MKAKRIQNISQKTVPLKLKNGQQVDLPSGSSLENVSITNEDELKGQVSFTRDLTEVNESEGKTRLLD